MKQAVFKEENKDEKEQIFTLSISLRVYALFCCPKAIFTFKWGKGDVFHCMAFVCFNSDSWKSNRSSLSYPQTDTVIKGTFKATECKEKTFLLLILICVLIHIALNQVFLRFIIKFRYIRKNEIAG